MAFDPGTLIYLLHTSQRDFEKPNPIDPSPCYYVYIQCRHITAQPEGQTKIVLLDSQVVQRYIKPRQ